MRILILSIIFIFSFTALVLAGVLIPNDLLFDSWDENNPQGNNWGQEFIKLPSAWDIETGSATTKVAIIDIGFDSAHEDLEENIVLIKPISTIVAHGTHVAGIIGAKGNNIKGVAGVMWNVSLYPYGAGIPGTDGLIDAFAAALFMKDAVNAGVNVINFSAGTTHNILSGVQRENDFWKILINWADRKRDTVTFVFAAGNDKNDFIYTSPANLSKEYDNVISVAANNNGQEVWSFPVNNRVDYITISPDQTIYFTSETGYLYALDLNTGDLKWDYNFGTFAIVRSAPAIGLDGTIYVIKPGSTFRNSILYAFNSDGSFKWSKGYGLGTAGSASIGQDGVIYAVSGYSLYAFNSQGEVIWTVSPGAEIETKTPAITNNQTIIVAGQQRVWAYNTADGSLKWTYQEIEELYPTLCAIDKDGAIYLGFRTTNVTGPSKILSLNSDGSIKWQHLLKWVYSPPAISDGQLYMAGIDEDNNYNLYAFKE